MTDVENTKIMAMKNYLFFMQKYFVIPTFFHYFATEFHSNLKTT